MIAKKVSTQMTRDQIVVCPSQAFDLNAAMYILIVAIIAFVVLGIFLSIRKSAEPRASVPIYDREEDEEKEEYDEDIPYSALSQDARDQINAILNDRWRD